jgi:hypothetical protein
LATLAACAARESVREQNKDVRVQAASPGVTARPDAASPPADGPSRLPEDEEAGLRAQAEWRQHLADEEEERQLLFDRQRLKAHAAIVLLAKSARARYDAARSKAAALAAQKTGARQMQELRQRVNRLDPWGVNSRLLDDYAWFAATLEGPYADAVRAAAEGHGEHRAQLAAEFDMRMARIADWLHKAAQSEEEGEAERERERRGRKASAAGD